MRNDMAIATQGSDLDELSRLFQADVAKREELVEICATAWQDG